MEGEEKNIAAVFMVKLETYCVDSSNSVVVDNRSELISLTI